MDVRAHVEHAYPPRPGAFTQGGDHIILDQELFVGRLHRKTQDALCKPARKFWGLDGGLRQLATANCKVCLARQDRLRAQGINVVITREATQ